METKKENNSDNEEIIIEDADLKNNTVEEADTKPLAKNTHAKKLIDDSKEIISTIDRDINETKNIIAENVFTLKEVKSELTNDTIIHTRVLLEKVKHPYIQEDDFEPFKIELGASPKKVSVKNISSGAFSGLLLAIIGMIATAMGWLFFSSKIIKEEIPLDKIPTKEFIMDKLQNEALFSWMNGNPQVGMGVMAVSTLLIGYIIYKVRVSIRENKNLKMATGTFEHSNEYAKEQKASKSEMLRVDNHIKALTPLIINYKVLLKEQNAKLERILHIEGELENHNDYQRTSKEIMQDTEKLMESVERLMSIAITKEGKLNHASQNALIDTKVIYESYLSKLYA